MHGKHQHIGFDDEERCKLEKYFSSLDERKKGSIGTSELEEPLIALGLADNRQKVEEMVSHADQDGSGNIEFEEFLTILKGTGGNATMARFFKSLIEGSLIKDANNLPFKLVVSTYRRKMIMNALMSKDSETKKEGERIMKAFAKQVSQPKQPKSPEIFSADVRIGFPKLPRIIDETAYTPEKMKEIMKLNKRT